MSSQEQTKPPVINVRGLKVGLGPYTRDHIEAYVNFNQDPETVIAASTTFDLLHLERETEFYDKLMKERGMVVFAIYELEKLEFIGTAHLRDINHRNGLATFGISIGRKDLWGRGYGTEAAALVLDYGFRYLNLYNIYLDTASFNERAIKSYKKVGFKETGRRRGVILVNGQRFDEIGMDCLASEFRPPVPGWPDYPASS